MDLEETIHKIDMECLKFSVAMAALLVADLALWIFMH